MTNASVSLLEKANYEINTVTEGVNASRRQVVKSLGETYTGGSLYRLFKENIV